MMLEVLTLLKLELIAEGSLPEDREVTIALVRGLIFAVLDEPNAGAFETMDA